MGSSFFDLPHPILEGHRGAAGECPENTLAGFRRAAEAGVDAIETDLRITADGEVVCIHDATVERTTDGAGRVDALSLDELRRLDAGARFTTDEGASFPFLDLGVRVPTLAESLEALPSVPFNLELKEAREDLVARTLEVVRAAGRAGSVLFSSFEEEALRLVRERAAR
ncbi:MAG: glycerophosphodiester phosphodiesterase family protein, partial [Planctomycetota bacterium]